MDAFTFFKELRPLGGNPNPLDSSLWHGFEQATFEAKKELDSLWADYTRRYASTASPSEVLALILDARLKRLDVIAEWMLRIFVAEEETARLYEEWLADLMRAEEKNVLDLVREEMPHYGEYFNHEEFTHALLLRQQTYKEKCDSKVIQLIRDRRAARATAATPSETNTSSPQSATANPNPNEIFASGEAARASDITPSLITDEGTEMDAQGEVWGKYRTWYEANLESLEAMAARSDPRHLPLDEQDAQRFVRNAVKQRFDELAEVEYRQWVDSGLPHETFSARLSELHAQILAASAELWSLGSEILRQWYEKNCKLPADDELNGKLRRWEHRARTTEIVRHLSEDHGLAVEGLIVKLEKLAAEEAREVPSWAHQRRLKAYVDPARCRIRNGFSGDFLESVRVVARELGIQMRPRSGVPPIQFCLQLLLSELVYEREPLSHPQIDRLDDEQLMRYVWAPYSGNSTTPESGQILNLCEALKWYCQRLIGLIDSRDIRNVKRKDPILASHGRDAKAASRKGDITLLQDLAGTLKNSVSYEHARLYLGVSRRQVERLVSAKRVLAVIGGGHNKQITVNSLLTYLPTQITT